MDWIGLNWMHSRWLLCRNSTETIIDSTKSRKFAYIGSKVSYVTKARETKKRNAYKMKYERTKYEMKYGMKKRNHWRTIVDRRADHRHQKKKTKERKRERKETKRNETKGTKELLPHIFVLFFFFLQMYCWSWGDQGWNICCCCCCSCKAILSYTCALNCTAGDTLETSP